MSKWFYLSEKSPEPGILIEVFLYKAQKYHHMFLGTWARQRNGQDTQYERIWIDQAGITRIACDLDRWKEMEYVKIENTNIIFDGNIDKIKCLRESRGQNGNIF